MKAETFFVFEKKLDRAIGNETCYGDGYSFASLHFQCL